MAKENGKKSKRTLWIVLIVLLVVLLTAAGSVAYVVDHYLDKINKVDPDDEYIVPPGEEDFEVDPDAPSWDEPSSDPSSGNASSDGTSSGSTSSPNSSSSKPVSSKPASSKPVVVTPPVTFDDSKLINILLVGQDKRPGETIRQRSDSMILCSINTKTKEVSLISFQRDLYVAIPGGYANNRLNAAYAFGGFKLLNNTLNKNFGVTIDGDFEVDFTRFQRVVDAVGGVDINLTTAEAQHMFGENAQAGVVHMDGQTALTYARIRYIDSDKNRTARQRNVLIAVFNKIKNKSVPELKELADTILPMLTTNLSNTQIVSLMGQLMPMLSGMKLSSYSIPGSGTYTSTYIRGMSVYVPNLNANRKLLRDKYLPLK